MESLISLFENTSVDSTGFLTADDIARCERLQAQHDEHVGELRKAIGILECNRKIFEQSNTLLLRYDNLIAELENDLAATATGLIKDVVRYINETYKLNHLPEEAKEAATWKEIINNLMQGKSTSFHDQGLQKAIKAFHNSLYPNTAALKGKTISLTNFSLSRWDWEPVSRWHDNFRSLLAMLSFNESGKLETLQALEDVMLATPAFGQIHTIGMKKLQAIKPYKNKRLDLIFSTHEYAFEFFTQTKLDQVNVRH